VIACVRVYYLSGIIKTRHQVDSESANQRDTSERFQLIIDKAKTQLATYFFVYAIVREKL